MKMNPKKNLFTNKLLRQSVGLLGLAVVLSSCEKMAVQQGELMQDVRLLAFPGAEGFGKYALGARGAENPSIYIVNNLNDSGPGSFRDAVSQPGRFVVFAVSGNKCIISLIKKIQ